MYESLTCFLPQLNETQEYGEWIIDLEHEGTLDDPKQFPFVNYGELADAIVQAIYAFVDAHPDYGLNDYQGILEDGGIAWGSEAMANADVSRLDGKTVMAMLLGVVRADRFCEGTLLEFFEKGHIKHWISRLQEIDSEDAARSGSAALACARSGRKAVQDFSDSLGLGESLDAADAKLPTDAELRAMQSYDQLNCRSQWDD